MANSNGSFQYLSDDALEQAIADAQNNLALARKIRGEYIADEDQAPFFEGELIALNSELQERTARRTIEEIDSTIRACGLLSLTSESSPGAVEHVVRQLSALIADADDIRRATIRDAALKKLNELGFSAPAQVLDAAIAKSAALDGKPPEADQKPFPEAAWTGLFGRWRDLIAPCTEAALENIWSALLVAAGMALGRNVWRESPQPLYPNFYLLLLGSTGDSRKSTVLWLLRALLTYAAVEFKNLAGVASAEGIYEALSLAEGTKALIYNDEFRSLLSVGKRQTTQNLLPKLNSLYYCPAEDSIDRVKDSTTIVDPFVSLVAATPRAYVDDLLTDLEVSGGFLNRFLVVTGNEQPPKPIVRAPLAGAWESIAAPLREIAARFESTPIHFEMTPDAERLWCDFYVAWKNERRGWQQKAAELTSRVFEHVLKIAVVYSALEGKSEITADALARAVAIGEWLQSNALMTFVDTGLDHMGKCERLIQQQLDRAKDGRAWKRDLQQVCAKRGFNAEIFGRAIKALEGSDVIEQSTVRTMAGRTRPVVALLREQETRKSASDKRSTVSCSQINTNGKQEK